MYFSQIIILVIIKIISKSSPAWTAVLVYSCGSSLKFSPKDHGRPDPRTWRRASRAAAARFGSWKHGQIASNYAKSRNCCNKRTRFSFFFDLFSVFRFFFSIVLCVFVFDSCRFSFTNHKFDKIQELQKKNIFFRFCFRFFSLFFNVFRTIFEPKKH